MSQVGAIPAGLAGGCGGGGVGEDGPEAVANDENQNDNNANDNDQKEEQQQNVQFEPEVDAEGEQPPKANEKKTDLLRKGHKSIVLGIGVVALFAFAAASAASYFGSDSFARILQWGVGAAVAVQDYSSTALSRMTGTASRVQTLNAKVAASEQEKLAMKTRIDELDSLSRMTGTASQVQSLEAKVAALEQEKMAMKTRIDELDSIVATMQDAMIISIARIDGDAKLQAQELSTLKDQVDRVEASVDGINALVKDEVETELQALMSEWDV